MPDRTDPTIVEIPVRIEHAVGLDPAKLTEHRLKSIAATRAMEICESLFWIVQHLGYLASEESWVYDRGDLNEALEHIGELGRAVAAGAGDQAQYLEHVAERLHKGERK
jgi:hypothetical protein